MGGIATKLFNKDISFLGFILALLNLISSIGFLVVLILSITNVIKDTSEILLLLMGLVLAFQTAQEWNNKRRIVAVISAVTALSIIISATVLLILA